jgi:hypothetical protein
VDDQPLESAWPDLVGALYRARLEATRAAAATGAQAAAALADRSTRYAAEVTAAKTDIRALVEANIPRFRQVLDLQPRVGEEVVEPFLADLAGLIDQRMDAAVTVLAAGGGIPEPTDPPVPDPGAGAFGSEPATQELTDLEQSLRLGLLGAANADLLPNTIDNFDHYLDGGGDTQFVLSDDVIEDVPGLQAEVREQVDGAVERATAEAAANGTYGQPIPFSTLWREFNITPAENRDWHYAIGNVHHQTTGTVTVHAPAEPGGPARVEVDYGVHLYDRYNWDLEPGKQAEIAGIPLPDEKFGPLHRAGLAQEYDIKGIPGDPRHETREVPG